MDKIVWLPPLLFILHDMEEIIFVSTWKTNESRRKKHFRIPFVPFGSYEKTESFSLSVYEELLLLTAASALGAFTDHYELWLGLLAANVIHLILIHVIGATLVYRSYVPGTVSAALTAIPCCLIFRQALSLLNYPLWKTAGSVILGVLFFAANLKFLHSRGEGIWHHVSSFIR